MRKLYDLLHAPMTLPKPFGKFHLLVLLVIFSLTIIFTIILIKSKHKNIWVNRLNFTSNFGNSKANLYRITFKTW